MIAVVDPFNRGASHAPFNSAFLEVVRAAFPDEEIIFISEAEHLAAVEEMTGSMSLEEKATIDPPTRNAGFWNRLPREFLNLRKSAMLASSGVLLLICDVTPATLYAVRAVLSLWPRRIRGVLCVLHSNANEIVAWRARNPLVRLRQLREAIVRTEHPRLHYLVLEHHIRDCLVEVLPSLGRSLHVLPHPIPSSEPLAYQRLPHPPNCCPPIDIAFLGAATERKGFGTFLRVANEVKRIVGDAVRFHALGWRPESEPVLDMGALSTPPASNYMSREEFRQQLARMHFVLLTLPDEIYGLSASGTLMDAIAAGKPILALRAKMLEDVLGSSALLDTPEMIVAHICELVRRTDITGSHWLGLAEAVRKVQSRRTPSLLAYNLREAVTPMVLK